MYILICTTLQPIQAKSRVFHGVIDKKFFNMTYNTRAQTRDALILLLRIEYEYDVVIFGTDTEMTTLRKRECAETHR